MRILLLAATRGELSPTLTWLREGCQRSERSVLVFPNCDIEVAFTGMGPVRTAFVLGQLLMEDERPHLAIQAGIAGAYDRNIPLGGVVNVVADRFLDEGAEERDGSLLGLPDIGFPYMAPFGPEGWLRPGGTGSVLPFPTVVGGTVSRATGAAPTVARIRSHFPEVQVESMEGAAFFYAGMSAGVETLQLRAISNYVEPRNRKVWKLAEAVSALDGALRKVLGPFLT